MKDFFKFLGVISLALVIGFSMAGCKTDDDDGDGDGSGSGSVVEWPDDIVFGTAALGNKKGNYTSGTNQMDIYNSISGTAQACSIGNVLFVIKSVSGKKITVNDYSADVVFCTDYTVTATTLTLTGGEGTFAQYSDITWTRK
jgi:hypothetical protein